MVVICLVCLGKYKLEKSRFIRCSQTVNSNPVICLMQIVKSNPLISLVQLDCEIQPLIGLVQLDCEIQP